MPIFFDGTQFRGNIAHGCFWVSPSENVRFSMLSDILSPTLLIGLWACTGIGGEE